MTHDESDNAHPRNRVSEVEDDRPADRPLEHLSPRLIALTFAGGCLGVGLRALLELGMPDGAGFPKTTFAVNITGALFLAVLIEWLGHRGESGSGTRRSVRVFLGTGVMGGFTTYSALAAQTDALVRTEQPWIALLYSVGTIAAGFIVSILGVTVMRRELSR